MANELITVEINSKNKSEVINLLNESNLIVEILNVSDTYTVIRDERVDPQPQVLISPKYNI